MTISNIKPAEKEILTPLTNIPNPPKELFFRGNLDNFGTKSVAIVGSRRPTAYGKEITYQISHALASKGINIISGLAFGVDAIAHQACLDAGGKTIAVLASGVDNITPRNNRGLGEQILAHNGAIISEFKSGHQVLPWHFLQRNRLVSGLADAVIITSANERSGTLSTAAHALNQGKDVYVLPGRITDSSSAGCNKLISQGAQIITSVDELVKILAPEKNSRQTTLPLSEDPIENKIIKLISEDIKDGEQIIKKAKIETSQFNYYMTMLEVKGVVKSLGANKWMLK